MPEDKQIPPNTTANVDANAPVVGPLQPPKEQASLEELSFDSQPSSVSTSPTLIHNLTLPPVPNLDIPLSPPGSPDPAANAKFFHFLTLKKQGIHFNEKLAISTSLRNPSLLKKLMEHAGIDDQAQYSTSLPVDIWDPSNLPGWGFKEELLKTQQEVRRKTEDKRLAGQRDSINFVSGAPLESSRAENGARTKATRQV